jgi:c-di-GMP-binding flagellar brake protein YcgR
MFGWSLVKTDSSRELDVMQVWPLNAGKRIPLPKVGERVRLQCAPVEGVGVCFANVKSVGVKTIDIQLELAASGSIEDLSDIASNRLMTLGNNQVMLTYDRGEAFYSFQTSIARKSANGALSILKPRQVTRIQRRDYYRLSLHSPTTYRLVYSSANLRLGAHAARIVNLSGGGAMIATNHPVGIGANVLIRIPVDKQGGLMDVESEALDCRTAEEGLSRAYIVRLKFHGPPSLTKEERDGIISYIFEQQRIMLKTRRILQ